ncbi:MAG: hypothetical protein J6V44_13070 [Methanobrevibacter sp.]|nr:hypothetical protein [Methanobrevibacter sp.]MBO7696798.1 hypothetical protein [Methanobrevibacter sp.]
MVIKINEGTGLSAYEISRILVDAGFGNEKEGFLDYFLEDNPKYCASVNLEDMGAYVADLDKSEHIPLPFANEKVRMILKTKEDVDDFLSFIDELNYDGIFESAKRNRRDKRAMKVNENVLKGKFTEKLYDAVENIVYLAETDLAQKVASEVKDYDVLWDSQYDSETLNDARDKYILELCTNLLGNFYL